MYRFDGVDEGLLDRETLGQDDLGLRIRSTRRMTAGGLLGCFLEILFQWLVDKD